MDIHGLTPSNVYLCPGDPQFDYTLRTNNSALSSPCGKCSGTNVFDKLEDEGVLELLLMMMMMKGRAHVGSKSSKQE